MFNFKDKVAVVTGGSKGIGKSIVDILSKNECQVISTSRINKANDPAVQALDLSCQQSIIRVKLHKLLREAGPCRILT